jgi:hypothetical protein
MWSQSIGLINQIDDPQRAFEQDFQKMLSLY